MRIEFYEIYGRFQIIAHRVRKRRQTHETVIEELLQVEVAERRARSIRYRMTQARFPIPKDLDSFEFDKLPVNEAQIQTLYAGDFIEQRRNIVFVGGTGTGKTHLSIAIARQAVRVAC